MREIVKEREREREREGEKQKVVRRLVLLLVWYIYIYTHTWIILFFQSRTDEIECLLLNTKKEKKNCCYCCNVKEHTDKYVTKNVYCHSGHTSFTSFAFDITVMTVVMMMMLMMQYCCIDALHSLLNIHPSTRQTKL